MAASIPSRYVGRIDNSQIMKRANGYSTYTAGLFLKDAAAFRNSIVSVLQVEGFEKGSDTKFTSTGKGFNLQTKQLSKPTLFAFDYAASDKSSTDAFFMQAMAQFLVMMFIQLIVDLERFDASANKDSKEKMVADCRAAVDMANHLVKDPRDPKNKSIIEPTAKITLLNGIAGELQKVVELEDSKLVVLVNFNQAPMAMDIKLKHDGKVVGVSIIDYRDVDTDNLMMIFNANIAATLMLAAKDKHLGAIQLNNLRPVLDGFMKVVRSVPGHAPRGNGFLGLGRININFGI